MGGTESIWTSRQWASLESLTSQRALSRDSDQAAWAVIAKSARRVLRTYSTSFFIVTRFLPPAKRAQVEVIYSAVRYPDEIVDTFQLNAEEKLSLLADWENAYLRALSICSLRDRLKAGLPAMVAGFAEVVRNARIPGEHYASFLSAMRLDVSPRRFENIEDLIDSYVYGSAIVVGYFLAYVYGPAKGDLTTPDFSRALDASRDLGVALQLTNFLRDVVEDQRRGRLYLPMDRLRREGISEPDVFDPAQQPALASVVRELSRTAEGYYSSAEQNVEAFAPDCRAAIRACIDVYRQLNRQVGISRSGIQFRETVPLHQKFRVLPASKYWRLPLAYLNTWQERHAAH